MSEATEVKTEKPVAVVKETKKVSKAKFTGKKKVSKAKGSKGTKKGTVKQGKGSTARRPRLDPKAKVIKTGKANPFPVDGAPFKRIQVVLSNSGKTVEQILALKGLRPTTVGTARRLGLVKVG